MSVNRNSQGSRPAAAPAARSPDQPHRSLRSRPFIAINLCFALSVGGWIPVSALLAIFMREHLQAGVIGAMVAVIIINSLSAGVSLFAGTLAARWGSRRTYLLGAMGIAICTALLAAAQESWHVIALAPLFGLAAPFHWTGANIYILQAVDARRRGTATGIATFVMVLGPGLAGPLLTAIGAQFGLWATILGGSGLLLLAWAGAWLLLPDIAGSHSGPAPGRRPSISDYPRLLLVRAILITSAARWISGFVHGVFQLLSALVVLDLTGQLSTVGWYLSAAAIGGGASQVAIGLASDRFGRRNLLVAAMLIGATSALLYWRPQSLALLLIGSALQWFGQASYQTLISAIVGDIVAPRDLATVSGMHVGFFSLGVVCGSLAAGLLWASDPGLPFLLAAICFLPVIVGLFYLPQRTISI
ncbi:MAG: MFS transporter [Chloroflexota bacterium]|nr:MFS transporter [Chloroflexota bacterium]